MARTQVVPPTWWLFALAALVALLLSAVGAQRAERRARGLFPAGGRGVAYVVVLLRYARRIEASPTAACQRRGDQAGRPNAEEPSHD